MRVESLVEAYAAIAKRQYTSRKKLSELCGFEPRESDDIARELKRLGLVSERIFPSAGKLSPLPLCFSMLSVNNNRVTLVRFNEAMRPVFSRTRQRNYSFHTVDDVAILLNECYEQNEIFPFLFCRGISELELKIFGDLLPAHIPVPDSESDIKEFMISCLIKQKISEKALAKTDEM